MKPSTWHSPAQRRIVGLTACILFHAFIVGRARPLTTGCWPRRRALEEEIDEPPPAENEALPPHFEAAPPPSFHRRISHLPRRWCRRHHRVTLSHQARWRSHDRAAGSGRSACTSRLRRRYVAARACFSVGRLLRTTSPPWAMQPTRMTRGSDKGEALIQFDLGPEWSDQGRQVTFAPCTRSSLAGMSVSSRNTSAKAKGHDVSVSGCRSPTSANQSACLPTCASEGAALFLRSGAAVITAKPTRSCPSGERA